MKTFLQFITENTATQQATRLGLEGDGHGGWYKEGEFVAKTEKGRLKFYNKRQKVGGKDPACLLYTSPSPRDGLLSRMPSSA